MRQKLKGFLKTVNPPGASIFPNLLRWQGVEVYEYICALAALHLRQTRRLQDLGITFLLLLVIIITAIQNSMPLDFKKWGQMDQSARKKARASLKALRKQRNEVAEWYGGLKHSSSNAWEDVKKGFLNSYQVIRDTFDKVQGEF